MSTTQKSTIPLFEDSNIFKVGLDYTIDTLQNLYGFEICDTSKKEIEQYLKDQSKYAKFDTVRFHNYTKRPVTISEIPSWRVANAYLSDNKPIASPYGTFFQQHDKSDNKPAKVLSYLMDTRNSEKKAMNSFKEGTLEYVSKDRNQKVFKLMANSWYGLLGQASFIFFNALLGPSITYQGVGIITSSVCGMEAFLANNIKFRKFTDILTFISNVIKDYKAIKADTATNFQIKDYLDADKIKSANDVLRYLSVDQAKFALTNGQIGILANIVAGLPHEALQYVFYKRNFMTFVSNSKVLALMLDCIPQDGEIFNDPNHPLKSITPQLESVYFVIRKVVGYEYAYYDRYELALTMEREGVALVDTDSNFLLLENLYNVVCDNAGLDKEAKSTIVNVCNIIVYICSQYIQKILDVYTGNMNIPEDKQDIIAMKSEFLYTKILLTPNKKQYAGIQLIREGKVFDTPKLDLKGLSIRKVSVNKTTRAYFTSLIENEMLGNDNFTHGDMYNSFLFYEQQLRKGISEYDMSFLQPAKMGEIDNYAFPWRIPVVRGTYIWNLLNPVEPVQAFEKVRIIKLNITKPDQLDGKVPDDVKEILLTKVFSMEEFKEKGIKYFAVPMDCENIPDWIKPFIDIETIIADNLNAAIPLYKSMEFLVTNVKQKNYVTNFIPMTL